MAVVLGSFSLMMAVFQCQLLLKQLLKKAAAVTVVSMAVVLEADGRCSVDSCFKNSCSIHSRFHLLNKDLLTL
jgi:hypothetical protein